MSPATPTAVPTRRRAEPAKRRLGLAVVFVLLGSFVPWVYTPLGSVSGAQGAGLWTFYAGMLGVAALVLKWRRVCAVQAGIMAAAALALPVWQLVHLLRLVGLGGWMPGPGLVLVFTGGVLGALAAYRLYLPPAE